MEAWSLEEAFVIRPIGSLAISAALPFATRALARAGLGVGALSEQALVPVRATQIAVAWLLGATALGPALASTPWSVATHAAAVACVALALVSDLATSREADERALGAGLGVSLVASVAVTSLFGRVGLSAGAVVLLFTGMFAFRAGAAEKDASGLAIGAVTSVLLAALFALPFALTAIGPDEATHAGDSTWRLRVDPWDEHAMLANAWASRRRGELDRALAQAREARRMGLGDGPALELAAEVLAAQGHCDAAQRAFDRALRVRASQTFDRDAALREPLLLGGYQIPPTLVTECQGLERLPDVSDLTGR